MSNYPIILVNLDSGVVVVGGGEVAARKVEGLLDARAGVTVISPQLTPELEQLACQGRIDVLRREYRPGDLAGARLVIAAADDARVNEAVWREARDRDILVSVVDDAARCTFYAPDVIHRGEVTVAIGTGESSPALARRLRQDLEAAVPPKYALLAKLLAALGPRVQASIPPHQREAVWRTLMDNLLPPLRDGQDRAAASQTAVEAILLDGLDSVSIRQ